MYYTVITNLEQFLSKGIEILRLIGGLWNWKTKTLCLFRLKAKTMSWQMQSQVEDIKYL